MNLPMAHLVQLAEEFAPFVALYVPGSHGVQDAVPGAFQKPAVQHAPAPAELPSPKAHAAQTDAPVAEVYLPVSHSVQEREPMASVALPNGQGVQNALPLPLYCPDWQIKQSCSDVPPGLRLYLPAPQVEHSEVLKAVVYLPGSHGVHSLAPSTLTEPAAHCLQASPLALPALGLYLPGAHLVQSVLLLEPILAL